MPALVLTQFSPYFVQFYILILFCIHLQLFVLVECWPFPFASITRFVSPPHVIVMFHQKKSVLWCVLVKIKPDLLSIPFFRRQWFNKYN